MPQADYSSAVGDHKSAPHAIPSDGDSNPAFGASAVTQSQQHRFAEETVRLNSQTTADPGLATNTPRD